LLSSSFFNQFKHLLFVCSCQISSNFPIEVQDQG
jgi:hypothetical protein